MSWESKGLSDAKNIPIIESTYSSAPRLEYNDEKLRLHFSFDLLRQNEAAYNHGSIINFYVVHLLPDSSFDKTINTLGYCLFGAVSVTKGGSDDISKYKYSGYGLGFSNKKYLHKDSDKSAYDLIIFGADLSDSSHAENKKYLGFRQKLC